MAVIHFFHLSHLLRELSPGSTIRIEAVARRIASDAPLERVALEVYARATTNSGDLLSWMLRTAESEARGPEPESSLLSPLFAANEAEADRVREFVAEQGFNVQRGLVDLGTAEPVRGVWREPELRAWIGS
jgi:hypothetical protein